jgi:hypothetical protein
MKRIHPKHSSRFNHDMRLEIDCYEWVLGKIEVNKIPSDRLKRIIRATIRNLEKRRDKVTVRSISSVGFVIFAIKNDK